MHKFIPLIILTSCLLLISSLCLAEDITITTYYPAPYGSYNELQLSPHSPPVSPCPGPAGVMYYDGTKLYICDGTTWQSLEGYWKLTGTNLYPNDLNWKVGIGTAAPVAQLQVEGSWGAVISARTTASDSSVVGIESRIVDDGIAILGRSMGAQGRGVVGIAYFGGEFSSSAPNGGALITNQGNVGFGIANPQNRLDVAGNAVIGTAYAGTTAATANGLLVEGNVGIGTANPINGKLEVQATGGNAIYASNPNGIGVYGESSQPYPPGPSGPGVYGMGINGSMGIVGRSDSNFGIFGITDTGVGVVGLSNAVVAPSIGVWGTANDMGVVGTGINTGVYGRSLTGYGIYCDGPKCGGTVPWEPPSDARLKKDIATVTNALDKVRKLRGVTFKWKRYPNKGRQMGFIAQEAIQVVPEVIGKGPDGFYTMTDSQITALLVEAIKAQQQEIVDLKARISQLETKGKAEK